MNNEQLERSFIFYLCEKFDLRPTEVVSILNQAYEALNSKSLEYRQQIQPEPVQEIVEDITE